MDAETGFLINGKIYPVPTIDSFNLDEAQLLYDYSGLALEDFVEPASETEEEREQRTRPRRNPGFTRALLHVAYQRGNPQLKPDKVKALIGAVNFIDALSTAAPAEDEEEAEGSPPAETTEPNGSSSSGSVTSSESSGPDSTRTSGEQASPREPIGTSA